MQERTFLIIPVSELSKVDFTQVLETSPDTVRRSVDGTKTFIKWEGVEPTFLGEVSRTCVKSTLFSSPTGIIRNVLSMLDTSHKWIWIFFWFVWYKVEVFYP